MRRILSPEITEDYLNENIGFKVTLENIAERFETTTEKVVDEINKFGQMLNDVIFSQRGIVYLEPVNGRGSQGGVITPAMTEESLIKLGLLAYSTWDENPSFRITIYYENEECRWAPEGHLHTLEKVYS